MQVVQGHDNLRGEEDGSRVVKAVNSAKISEEFATGHILQQHVEESIVMVSPHPEREYSRQFIEISLVAEYK